jgi:hypothetical protein
MLIRHGKPRLTPLLRLTLLLGLTGLLCALSVACSKSAPTAQTLAATQAGTAASGSRAGSAADPEMVSAVSAAGNSTTPVSMKFKLAARPIVTMPVQLLVSLLPAPEVAISHIRISFQAGEGLQLQSEKILDVSEPTPGTPIQQELTLMPQQNGVLSLTATVLVDTDRGSISRTYSIPLIATDGRT